MAQAGRYVSFTLRDYTITRQTVTTLYSPIELSHEERGYGNTQILWVLERKLVSIQLPIAQAGRYVNFSLRDWLRKLVSVHLPIAQAGRYVSFSLRDYTITRQTVTTLYSPIELSHEERGYGNTQIFPYVPIAQAGRYVSFSLRDYTITRQTVTTLCSLSIVSMPRVMYLWVLGRKLVSVHLPIAQAGRYVSFSLRDYTITRQTVTTLCSPIVESHEEHCNVSIVSMPRVMYLWVLGRIVSVHLPIAQAGRYVSFSLRDYTITRQTVTTLCSPIVESHEEHCNVSIVSMPRVMYLWVLGRISFRTLANNKQDVINNTLLAYRRSMRNVATITHRLKLVSVHLPIAQAGRYVRLRLSDYTITRQTVTTLYSAIELSHEEHCNVSIVSMPRVMYLWVLGRKLVSVHLPIAQAGRYVSFSLRDYTITRQTVTTLCSPIVESHEEHCNVSIVSMPRVMYLWVLGRKLVSVHSPIAQAGRYVRLRLSDYTITRQTVTTLYSAIVESHEERGYDNTQNVMLVKKPQDGNLEDGEIRGWVLDLTPGVSYRRVGRLTDMLFLFTALRLSVSEAFHPRGRKNFTSLEVGRRYGNTGFKRYQAILVRATLVSSIPSACSGEWPVLSWRERNDIQLSNSVYTGWKCKVCSRPNCQLPAVGYNGVSALHYHMMRLQHRRTALTLFTSPHRALTVPALPLYLCDL
ncbi:hypothetical protein J6590_006510 [Homalodisca vitripennis]|nr:hypothetical protein J6590_006510 [Homalodisca vitripennis]